MTDDYNYLSARCPICNSDKKMQLVTFKSDAPLKHLSISPRDSSYEKLRNQIIERWRSDNCNFAECENCHFNYAIPFVAGSNELYSFFYNDPEAHATLNWEHILAKKLILKKFRGKNLENKKLLEFGPGDGGFVKDIVDAGFKSNNVVCIESSENCIKALNDFGINCLSSDLSKINLCEIENKFNVVAMFQVLEHMDKIDDTFRFINKITTEDASMFIAVPNNIIRRFYEKNGVFLDVPPIHVSRWDKENFKRLGEKYGWKIQYHEIEKVSFFTSAYNFIWNKHLNKWVGKMKKRSTRKLLIGIFLIPLFVLNFFSIIKIKSNSNGTSQLVHLEKI